MKELTVWLYGEQTNNAVLKLPGRQFPGVLLQGDTLRNLLDTSKQVLNLARQQEHIELIDEADGLTEMLSEIYQSYMHEVESAESKRCRRN